MENNAVTERVHTFEAVRYLETLEILKDLSTKITIFQEIINSYLNSSEVAISKVRDEKETLVNLILENKHAAIMSIGEAKDFGLEELRNFDLVQLKGLRSDVNRLRNNIQSQNRNFIYYAVALFFMNFLVFLVFFLLKK